jgi:hypothetical protein
MEKDQQENDFVSPLRQDIGTWDEIFSVYLGAVWRGRQTMSLEYRLGEFELRVDDSLIVVDNHDQFHSFIA